ncbi:MAG: AsmA family protein [Rhodocyclales bacterium]|nr:AsmA family protein [Rhodocyclales bacterium]
MKALRILGIALGVLGALLAIGIGLLLALFDGEKLKSELSRVVLEQKQRKLDIAGKVELSLWPEAALTLGRVSLSEPGGKQEFAALDSARVAVAVLPLLSKQVQVQRIEVAGLQATLVKHKDGTLNIADLIGDNGTAKPAPKVGAGDTASTPVQLDIAGIKLSNAQLTWRDEKAGSTTALSRLDIGSGRIRADGAQRSLAIDALAVSATGKTGADNFELKLEAPRLQLSPEKSGGETLSLSALLSGSGRNLAAKLVLSGVEGSTQALKIGKLALELDAKAGEATVKGRLESPVAADLAAQTLALENLAGKIDVVSPQMPMKQLSLPISGKLRSDLARQSAALELGTRFDDSKIALKLNVAKFAPLALGFELDIDQLNVDNYLPPSANKPAQKAPGDDKLDFSALKGHEVHGGIRIGALQASKLKFSKLNATLKLAAGRLDLAPINLNLYEGTTAGSLMLNANGNQLALKQNLSGISINPLLKDLAGKDLLEGRGNLALDLASRGDSVAAMKKALAGTASLSLKDGAIKGINLAQSLRDIKGKLGSKQDSTQQAKAGEKTDFSELGASLKIANGVAHNEDLSMKSPFLRLTGAGDIDIGGGQMNYLARASVVANSTGQGGQGLEHLKGLTVPLRVSGPFEALAYKLELGSLVSEAAKAKVEEKSAEIKAKAQDQVKDKLKGLFGK